MIRILVVRMGKCVVSHEVKNAVRGLVFTPDGKGIVTGSTEPMVIHWDVSWLESTHDHDDNTEDPKEDIPTQDLTGGLKEMSRFVGHKVSLFRPSLLSPLLMNHFKCIRVVLPLFLYPPMAIGLRLAHGTRLFEYGMPILLHCSVFCMVREQLRSSVSVVSRIISQS